MTTRNYMNSDLRGVLRACAVESPPSRSELRAELRLAGVPSEFEDQALRAAEMVAKAAAEGPVGNRKAQARLLADEVGEEVWCAMQAGDSLAPTDHDPDDGYDPEAAAAEAYARVASGVREQGRPHTPATRPSVPWRQR